MYEPLSCSQFKVVRRQSDELKVPFFNIIDSKIDNGKDQLSSFYLANLSQRATTTSVRFILQSSERREC